MNIIFFSTELGERKINIYLIYIFLIEKINYLNTSFDKIEQSLRYKVLIQNNYSVLLN